MAVGLAGFDPKLDNGPEVIGMLQAVALVAPALILVAGALLAVRFPVDRRRHAIVLHALGRRGAERSADRRRCVRCGPSHPGGGPKPNPRSDKLRVAKEGVTSCTSRWATYQYKK